MGIYGSEPWSAVPHGRSDHAVSPGVHLAGTLSFSADNKDGVLLATTQTTDHSMPSTDGELA